MVDGVLFSSDSGEWKTPQWLIEKVRTCMGSIELDPCAGPDRWWVGAAKTYTIHDDGLAWEWSGRVYMNPPYGRNVQRWTQKCRSQFDKGQVTQAIALLPARTDTVWFHGLVDGLAVDLCFVKGRVKFVGSADYPAPFPSVIIGLGTNTDRFRECFGSIGLVLGTGERSGAEGMASAIVG